MQRHGGRRKYGSLELPQKFQSGGRKAVYELVDLVN